MTEIKVLLDKSGSMYTVKDDMIGGYNAFLDVQKRSENAENITWSLSTFSTDYDREFINKPVKDVEHLTHEKYDIFGSTALYDAIGTLLQETIEDSHKVYIVVIITDGVENSSKIYNAQIIKDLIENKTSKERNENHATWDFVYLGANQDSILESSKIGIPQHSTIDYNCNAKSVEEVYKAVSSAVCRKISQEDDTVAFTPLERTATQTLDIVSPPVIIRNR